MNTSTNSSTTIGAQISAFADGELNAQQHEQLLKALRDPAARDTWDAYHLIGDTLRANDSAVRLSDGFSERMAARLAIEPSFLGTAPLTARTDVAGDASTAAATAAGAMRRPAWRRAALPGAAMAATVLLAVTVGPRLQAPHGDTLASAAKPAIAATVAAGSREEQAVLRNPEIDEYLIAHQRFSPSLYSTAQYARPSTFAIESVK